MSQPLTKNPPAISALCAEQKVKTTNLSELQKRSSRNNGYSSVPKTKSSSTKNPALTGTTVNGHLKKKVITSLEAGDIPTTKIVQNEKNCAQSNNQLISSSRHNHKHSSKSLTKAGSDLKTAYTLLNEVKSSDKAQNTNLNQSEPGKTSHQKSCISSTTNVSLNDAKNGNVETGTTRKRLSGESTHKSRNASLKKSSNSSLESPKNTLKPSHQRKKDIENRVAFHSPSCSLVYGIGGICTCKRSSDKVVITSSTQKKSSTSNYDWSKEYPSELQTLNRMAVMLHVVKELGSDWKSFCKPLPKISKPTLFLDIDETLLHATASVPLENVHHDFCIEAGDEYGKAIYYVYLRPYVTQFIEAMSQNYELVAFTAGIQNYAEKILEKLDPTSLIKHRLFRQHCDPICVDGVPVFVKSLTHTKRDLSRSVILDNSILSFAANISNGFHIVNFEGDKKDTELLQLIPILSLLSMQRDVRKVLRRNNCVHSKVRLFMQDKERGAFQSLFQPSVVQIQSHDGPLVFIADFVDESTGRASLLPIDRETWESALATAAEQEEMEAQVESSEMLHLTAYDEVTLSAIEPEEHELVEVNAPSINLNLDEEEESVESEKCSIFDSTDDSTTMGIQSSDKISSSYSSDEETNKTYTSVSSSRPTTECSYEDLISDMDLDCFIADEATNDVALLHDTKFSFGSSVYASQKVEHSRSYRGLHVTSIHTIDYNYPVKPKKREKQYRIDR